MTKFEHELAVTNAVRVKSGLAPLSADEFRAAKEDLATYSHVSMSVTSDKILKAVDAIVPSTWTDSQKASVLGATFSIFLVEHPSVTQDEKDGFIDLLINRHSSLFAQPRFDLDGLFNLPTGGEA